MATEAINTTESSQASPVRDARGINLCGYLRDESGWGAAGRGYVAALRALDVPLSLLDISHLSTNRSEDASLAGFASEHPYGLNLVCVDPSQHFALLDKVGMPFFEGHYNIGAWAWELPNFPLGWYDRFAYYDEIWVTTSFVADSIAPVSPVPVVRIPPVLTKQQHGLRARGRANLKTGEGETIYLFIFDFHSHLARKNPLALIDAFKQAFGAGEAARLIIKTVNAADDPTGVAQMRERAAGSNITIVDGYWSAEEMRDLMAACDCYVSLHRSEGTGLTITDAMAHGKPVIATGWSGNMDFMTVANSFPVRYRLVEIEQNVGPYKAGQTWAEASVEHAAELMRLVYERPGEARQRGEQALSDIETHFSAEAVARLIAERLSAIEKRRNLAAYTEETRAHYLNYLRLHREVRQVVSDVLPQGATVAVVSKGDEGLVAFEGGRRGMHFPQNEQGIYAGYYPANSQAAIDHLSEVQARGAEYLLFPNVAYWWLDHYSDFGTHLDTYHTLVADNEVCKIYKLSGSDASRDTQFERLLAHIEDIASKEAALREMLYRLDLEPASTPAGTPTRAVEQVPQHPLATQDAVVAAPRAENKWESYQQLKRELADSVASATPEGTRIAVVSKGDSELLRFPGGRRGMHFPQNERGVYAGYYPADSKAAIEHLTSLRGRGAEYLLLPNTAFWWLDYYADFRAHLESEHEQVLSNDNFKLYRLNDVTPAKSEGGVWHRIFGRDQREQGRNASV